MKLRKWNNRSEEEDREHPSHVPTDYHKRHVLPTDTLSKPRQSVRRLDGLAGSLGMRPEGSIPHLQIV